MDTKALQLASCFALPPNSLGYCGKGTAPSKLIDCAIKGECHGVEKELNQFIVLNPYLKTLSIITGLDKFSYPVVEAYWLGNSQLKKVKSEHYHLLLENFRQQGVPRWLVGELKENVPNKFIPFHLFQVLHVGVGRASGSVPLNMKTINSCMVRWGKVKKIKNRKVRLNLHSLKRVGQNYYPTMRQETILFQQELIPELNIGDKIAVHWGQVVKLLTPHEEKNLSFWTKKVLLSLKSKKV